MTKVYLDYAGSTNTREEVWKTMLPFFAFKGNPSALHEEGRKAKKAINDARQKIAGFMSADSSEIIFTSGGSEANNLAIIGTALANQNKGRHLITTTTEHHSVFNTFKFLETQGFKITFVPVDEFGMVNIDELLKAITDETILVSVIYANNEIGTINPIAEIAKLCHEKKADLLVHTDACQALNYLKIDVQNLGIDLLSLNSGKIYGPKGVGLLYVKKGTKIIPIIHGGEQELNRRAGTENVPGIVGFAKAFELIEEEREAEGKRLTILRDKLISQILTKIPRTRLNGHRLNRLPNNVNISFFDVEGESILLYLDHYGICATTGSACSSADLEPSHVLMAMGLSAEIAHGSIRFTFGLETTEAEIDYVLSVLPGIIENLRQMSPIKVK